MQIRGGDRKKNKREKIEAQISCEVPAPLPKVHIPAPLEN